MVVGFTTTCAISAYHVSLNPIHGEVYLIQQYVIKFVSDLWQVSGCLGLWFPPQIKLIATMQSCLPLLTNVSIPAVSCQYFEHFVSIKDEYNIIGNSGLVNHSFIWRTPGYMNKQWLWLLLFAVYCCFCTLLYSILMLKYYAFSLLIWIVS